MKKFSLKKITAAVSAAAMIATMGTSAFAANVIQSSSGITIKGITVTQRTDDSELYNVSVEYETTEVQGIGTTMLTYVKHGDALSSVTAYDKDTMNIVGVDQKNDTSAFTFTVTTDSSASNGIYMVPGESGLLMLSGDKVTSPAVATLAIAALKVENTDLGNIAIINGADATDTAKKNAIINAVGAVKFTNTDGVSEDVTLAAENVTITKTGATITYNNYSVDVTASFVAKAFDVAEITLLTDNDEVYTADSFLNDTADVNDQVAAKIKKVRVTGAEEEGMIPSETWTIGTDGAAVSVAGTAANDSETDLTVTVTAPASAKGDLKGKTATVKVTLAADTTKIATSYKLFDLNGTEVPSTGVKLTKSEELSAPLPAEYSVKLYNNQNEEIDAGKWEITAFVWNPLFNGNTEGTYVGTATIAPKSGETTEATGVDKLTITLTVVVEEQQGDPIYLGDVNGDGKINGQDWQAIMNHLSEFRINADLNDKNSIAYKAANINGDDKLNGQDWQAIMNHLSEFRVNDKIGTEIVGYKSK